MKVFFVVDIGGTGVKFGAFDQNGQLIDKWSILTNLSDSGQKIIPDVVKSINTYIARKEGLYNIGGIGMGIPGPVDKKGYVKTCVNLHWTEFNPVEELKKEFPDVAIAAGNDANVAALGEYYRGAGKEYSSMMLITLGTGVGGGIVIDGKVLLGANGLAGEVGHISGGIAETEKCNCGNVGCIDQFASATGIVRIMKKLLNEQDGFSKLCNKEKFTAKDVCMAAEQGDELALQCIDICMSALGTGLAFFSHAFDPEVYVIGGGVSRAGGLIIDVIKKAYLKRLFLIDKGADIKLATLGNDAGIIGACMLVMNGE